MERLEAQQPERWAPWHRLILRDGEDADARIAAMVASGEAQAGDNFIVRVIIDPPNWEAIR